MVSHKKRRGMASLLETVLCLVLFSFALIMILTIGSHIGAWNASLVRSTNTEQDIDYFIQIFTNDVKSSRQVTVSDTGIEIVTNNELIIYAHGIDEGGAGTLYRNNEYVISGLTDVSFSYTGETVQAYLLMNNGEIVNFTIRR